MAKQSDSLKVKVTSNFFWRLMERFGAQAVTFIVSIILARVLGPSEYGVVAIATIFMVILQVFVDAGFSTALIQKKDADDLDFSSVFFFNIFICSFLYLLLFFAAPLISYKSTRKKGMFFDIFSDSFSISLRLLGGVIGVAELLCPDRFISR